MAIIPTSGEFTKVPEGGGNGAFFVTDNNNTLDKTWAEISAASENGVVVLKLSDNKFGYLVRVAYVEERSIYGCMFMLAARGLEGNLVAGFQSYTTSAEDGYPVQ